MPNRRKGDEYPPKSGILITAKRNPSGSRAYRVDIAASITGRAREQRQFPTKEAAEGHARRRHEEITQFGHGAFALTARQREDALRAIEILAGYSLSLEDVAKLAATQFPSAKQQLTVTELRERFLAAPGRRRTKVLQRRPLTVQNLRWRTARFQSRFGDRTASEVRAEEVQEWLRSLGPLSSVSLNNYRRVLHAMFSYGVTQRHCVDNPIARIPLFVVPDRAPSILTVEQAERLVSVAANYQDALGLLGYVTLGLFAGLRRAEIERLDWTAVKWERRMVTVDGSIAKTGSIRNVALSENAMRWLQICNATSGRVVPRGINEKLRRLRCLAGITTWHRNALRHSFASYHFDLHQNAALTAAQLGHNSGVALLFEHYRSLVPLGDGERYFAVMPRLAEAPKQIA